MISQKEAVYEIIAEAMSILGISVGKVPALMVLNRDVRDICVEKLSIKIADGSVAAKVSDKDQSVIRAYASNLISNWVRRDERLNCGMHYIPKLVASDKLLKDLYSMLTKYEEDSEEYDMIRRRIIDREDELQAQADKNKLDTSQIPDDLAIKLGLRDKKDE